MKRLWFKKEMRDAIVRGEKTSTSRKHPLKVGETYTAVCGSRFNAYPFAHVKIDSIQLLPFGDVARLHWKEEGFKSEKDMQTWISAHLPGYEGVELWYHEFHVLK